MDTDLTPLRLDQNMMGRQITVNDKGHLAVSSTSSDRDKRFLHNTLQQHFSSQTGCDGSEGVCGRYPTRGLWRYRGNNMPRSCHSAGSSSG